MNEDFKKIQKQLINDLLILGILSLISAVYYLIAKLNFMNIIFTTLLFMGLYNAKKGNQIAGKIGIVSGVLMMLTILNFDIIDFILGFFVLKRSINYNKFFPNDKNDKLFCIVLIVLSFIYIGLFLVANINILSNKTNQVDSFEQCIIDEYNKVNSKSVIKYSDLSQEDLNTIKEIECRGKNISSINVSNLQNLEVLDLVYNKISSIDISNNLKLKKLVLEDNNLSEIDLSNNTNLEFISLSRNKIYIINLCDNINLKELWMNENLITTVNLSNQKLLEELYLYGNSIDNIDVSNNRDLKVLWIGNNPLNNIDISHNLLLEELQIEKTNLSLLDVTNNKNLKYINANTDALKIIGAENNTQLKIEHRA